MAARDPLQAREFAVEVVRILRAAGHQALWAGGCVRDRLMGEPPKDYDVATDATPDRVREVFGLRRTLPIGASFGVITVIGRRGQGQLDVATFRKDGGYSDGRHPDTVTFADAEQDAQRRDFTLNGLFYDPIDDRVLDFVGGQEDMARKLIRAIGDPGARIAEDKLRMLRAVRFAARFDFAIDRPTLQAIRRHAPDLGQVSAERIAAELRMILTHPSRARGLVLLDDAGLLPVVLPEVAGMRTGESRDTPWSRTMQVLSALKQPTFSMALAGLLRELVQADATQYDLPRNLFERWKLSNEELEGVEKLLAEEPLVRSARNTPWPKLQRILIAPRIEELLGYAEAVGAALGDPPDDLAYCRAKLALPREELDPPPLITGNDLKAAGIRPGPAFRSILEQVRDAQLDGLIRTKEEALERARAAAEG